MGLSCLSSFEDDLPDSFFFIEVITYEKISISQGILPPVYRRAYAFASFVLLLLHAEPFQLLPREPFGCGDGLRVARVLQASLLHEVGLVASSTSS